VDLHIVGGFLGSGKTTAIIGAAKALMAGGKRVGVVTNDQGRYLVDTAFFQSASVPTVEVTGGCFCCNYSDLDTQLAQLKATAQPDVIFAESVGSCADIVATVVKPLLELGRSELGEPASFTVFADARLLRRRLLDQPMPFSDDVVYVFDKQIEEAGMLIVNKRDLLPAEQAEELAALALARFGGRTVRLQNSLKSEDVLGWVAALEAGQAVPPSAALDIDYERYGAGEAGLAWLDERLSFTVREGTGKAVVTEFMRVLLARLAQHGAAVGHVKFFVEAAGTQTKVSFPTLETAGWESEIPELPGTRVAILVNARVEMAAAELRDLVHGAVDASVAEMGATAESSDVAFFHPVFPNPTHRIQ